MKNLKKVLALVMAFAMAFTMMAGAAYTDQADIVATEAVDTLAALNVMTGDPDGSFRPNDSITRAEACRMIYTIRNGGKEDADAYKGMQTTFTDVDGHWAAGYIKHCQSVGIVSGKSATIFDPNAKVTGVELALMCLRVMGYDPAKVDIGGSTWSIKTIGLATEAGLLEDVEAPVEAACPRQWAAQIMFNMISANTVKWSKDADEYNETDVEVGEKYMDLVTYKNGVLVSAEKEDSKDTYAVTIAYAPDKDGEVATKTFSKVAKDYADLMGQKVRVMTKEGKADKVYGVFADSDSNVIVEDIVGNIADLEDVKLNDKVKVDGVEYKTDSKITGYWFNVETPIASVAAAAEVKGYEAFNFKAIDNDDDNKIDTVVVFPVAVEKVTYVNKTTVRAGAEYKFEDDTIYEGVAKDDYAVITKKANTTDDKNVLVKADTVEGKVTSVKDDKVKVDGEWYVNATGDDILSINQEVELVVYNGYYFAAPDASIDVDLAVVSGVGNYDAMEETTAVKLIFADGSEKVIAVDGKLENGAFAKGDLVVYDIDDDKYTLTKVTAEGAKLDDMEAVKAKTTAAYDKSKAIVTVDTKDYDVASDALVVIKNKSGDLVTMTGADLLKRNDMDLANVVLVHDEMEIVAMYAEVSVSMTSGDELYGYVVDRTLALNADDDKVWYIDVIVDGEKLLNVETDVDDKGTVADFITYTMDGDVMCVENMADSELTTGSIKEFTDTRVRFRDDARLTLTDDTVIIAVDSDDADDIKYAGNTLAEAEELSKDVYANNAKYAVDDDEITVIFVEVAAGKQWVAAAE